MEFQFDITPYIGGIFLIIAFFITTRLIPMIKAKTTISQQEIIQAGASTVVYAAEQLFGSGKGKEKLAYALAQLQERLEKYGIKLDPAALRPYIEAAVKALNLRQDMNVLFSDDSIPGLAEFIRSDDEGK